jgi:hypothetical protein
MERVVVARWESRRGKDWVELYRDRFGYGYSSRGSFGWFGSVTQEAAMAEIGRCMRMGCFCAQKSPMKRVV